MVPKVSVLMSVFKEPIEWIRQSIDSVLKQSFTDFEFIIINDCPERRDNAIVLNEYKRRDQRVHVIHNKENLGLTKSLNIGLSISTGEYIARMDADDISLPNRFMNQTEFLNSNPHIDICHCAFQLIDEDGNCVGNRVLKKIEREASYLFLFDVIAHPSIMFRSRLKGLRCPLYNEQYRNAQDYELWAFLLLNGIQFGYIPEVMLLYRLSKNQITYHDKNKQTENGRAIRRYLIYNYLNQYNSAYEFQSNDVSYLLSVLKNKDYCPDDKVRRLVKYLLYFSCVRYTSGKYIILYLIDRDALFFTLPIRCSIKVILSSFCRDRWDNLEF